jgi:hypothetical protein
VGDLWNWVASVFGRIGDISVYWLVLALALKTAESALIAVGWRNILRAAYPRVELSFKTAWGASQGGTAINALLPAQAGTAAMLGIFRASIPGSSVAGLASATVVQSLFFVVVSVPIVIAAVIFRPKTVSKGSPSDESADFLGSHPILVAVIVITVVLLVRVFWPRLQPRLLASWQKVKQGAAVFSNRRAYLRTVAAPQAASYGCRMGVNASFMAAFGIPVTAYTVTLVASAHTLSQLFAITPGGVGQTQALDVATLRPYASSAHVAAFSIVQDSILTVWNVVLGIAVMAWAFGYRRMRQLLSRKGPAAAEGAAGDPQAPA